MWLIDSVQCVGLLMSIRSGTFQTITFSVTSVGKGLKLEQQTTLP
jgi:hypothetical protein